MSKKQYIGDSVYADFDGHSIVLTTENGFGASNTIYMEPQIVETLFDYIEKCWNVKIDMKSIHKDIKIINEEEIP